jgi:hypothetical protein
MAIPLTFSSTDTFGIASFSSSKQPAPFSPLHFFQHLVTPHHNLQRGLMVKDYKIFL